MLSVWPVILDLGQGSTLLRWGGYVFEAAEVESERGQAPAVAYGTTDFFSCQTEKS